MRKITPGSFPDLPLYKEVKRQMVEALSSQEWKPGVAVPSGRSLSARLGVSMGTVRKAIDELVLENILVRQQGRGTFVAEHSPESRMFRFFNYETHDGVQKEPEVAIVGFSESKADKIVAAKLGIAPGATVLNILTVRGFGSPMMFDHIRIPKKFFRKMTRESLLPSAMYRQYQSQYGINVVRLEEAVRAANASEEQAAILQVAPGTALLEVHRVAYSFHDRPVEYRISYINTAHHQYVRSVV
ncbi:MAG TPA: GntR family transcriptional regulator [Herbaspirillum sp.]|jgi:GntR family transcriptional regulator